MWQYMMGNQGICGGAGTGAGIGGGWFFGGLIIWIVWLILSIELMFVFWYLIGWLKKK